jgi:hypothetical protein
VAFQTIDEAEYRIFAAIDGSRCIDEILPIAAAAGVQHKEDGVHRRAVRHPRVVAAQWGHRQVVGCWIVKGAIDRSTVVGRRDHAAMATPVTSAQVANAWRRAE